MIKGIITLCLSLLFTSQTVIASEAPLNLSSGRLFNLITVGNKLSIPTMKAAKFYQYAGLKALRLDCLFAVSDRVSATLMLARPAIRPAFKMCLNGLGKTYSCEKASIKERFAYIVNEGNKNVLLCLVLF